MMENKKKSIVANKIDAKNTRLDKYEDEFEYLINAGIALDVSAITALFQLGIIKCLHSLV